VTAALWLAARDVCVRWRRALLAAGVVAAITASGVAMELVARAREQAVAARIDAIGPSLTVVAAGVTSGALARLELGPAGLDPETRREVEQALGGELRRVEARIVSRRDVGGFPAAVIGIDRTTADGAELGAELARKLGPPDAVTLAGERASVTAVRPSTGDVEDLAVFVPRAIASRAAGATEPNVLRLFLRAGVTPRAAEARLAAAGLAAAVIRHDRGEVADRESQDVLARHRRTVLVVLVAVAALCLLLAAHLDAAERRLEIATLVAVGASRGAVLATIVSRSAVVALAGALAGTAAAVLIAAGQDADAAAGLVREWPVVGAAVGGALLLGIGAAAPTALASAARDPVPELQEAS
jgi:hypothetical protein